MANKRRELVKCVVVGDTAVGKTRLICARACNKHVSLSQLLSTHVPTVWAIDQYRIYKDVLERSWEVVDGVNVSLRLWDTFGDHEKDRRFAYGRSDVVLLCFSLTNPVSLRNCKAMWYPEIRRFCPQTPIILVGCKNDLRYMYRDETYLGFFRDHSPFVRATRKADLVMPDQARAIAKELGIHYYETSVLTYYGINEVFENAIRAALIARRAQRFWITNLKKVQRPLLQAPFKPPKPMLPEVYIAGSSYVEHLHQLWLQQAYTDLVLVAGSVGFSAHRFMLAAASPTFHRLLVMDFTSEMGARSSSESSMVVLETDCDSHHGTVAVEPVAELQGDLGCSSSSSSTLGNCLKDSVSRPKVSSFGEATVGDFNDDTELLIRQSENYLKPSRVWEQLKRRSSCQVLSTDSNKRLGVSRELNHPAFQTIRIEQCDGVDGQRGRAYSSLQTVVTLSKLVTPLAIQQCLQFLYTGTIDSRFCKLQEIRQAAEFLDLPELLLFVSNIQDHEEFLNTDLKQKYRKAVRLRLQEMCLGQGLFSDIVFQLDDGSYAAHRPMLMARCDMMKAMFSGDFRESNAKVIMFPGVREDTFHKLLVFLYTDDVPPVEPERCLDLLELGNRLCLPRLVNLVERRVVEEMIRLSTVELAEAVEHCLRLLEPCKLHNADQLADWCMNFLCTNYNKLCKMSPKLLRALHPENQEYLSEHRWPPVWYLKDYDNYQKCSMEREKEEKPSLKRGRHNSGCLCFSGGKRRESDRAFLSGASTV